MNDPINHHYLPVFYLNKWRGSDGKVVRFYRPRDVVVASRIAPSNTGYEPRLYTLDRYPPEQQQYLEKYFFGPAVDNPAAVAMEILLVTGPKKLTVEMRTAWTRFVMSMQLRSPHSLLEIKALAGRTLRENLSKAADVEYEAARKDGDPPTLYDWAMKHLPAQMENMHKAWLPGLVDHEVIGAQIMNMHWTVLDLSSARYPLLTGDRPYMTTYGLGDRRAVLAVPISPHHLFIAANSPNARQAFDAQGNTETARGANAWIVGLAVKQVYGNSDRALRFVDRRLVRNGEAPVPGVIARDPQALPL